jgi:hypothetical protein
VKKRERLDEATTPDGTVLTLFRHDGAYSATSGTWDTLFLARAP